MILAPTCAGVAPGLELRYCAAAPATCGLAIDVPSMIAVAVGLPMDAPRMSTHVPQFEDQNPPVRVVDGGHGDCLNGGVTGANPTRELGVLRADIGGDDVHVDSNSGAAVAVVHPVMARALVGPIDASAGLGKLVASPIF